MPSESQPADTGEGVQAFPKIVERIGENPARFLDRDVMGTTPEGQSKPSLMLEARIQGIDYLEVIGCYLAVETQLDREECPRSGVMNLLEERKAWLEDHGDRDERAEYAATPGTVETTESCVEWNTDDGEQRRVATAGWS